MGLLLHFSGRLQALPSNKLHSWKSLTVTNILDYNRTGLIMIEGSFKVQVPGANGIKLFSSSLTNWQNQLERFHLATLYQPILIFASKAVTYPIRCSHKNYTRQERLGQMLQLIQSQRQRQRKCFITCYNGVNYNIKHLTLEGNADQ